MQHNHIVYSAKRNNSGRPVKEITTNLSFKTILEASKHFKISQNVIFKSANNRAKYPRHPYKFEWIIKND